MSAVGTLVTEAIANHKVVVFSKTYCPYCRAAKELLKQHTDDVTIFELDKREDGADIQNFLNSSKSPGQQRTVPNIFINQKHIGGNDALQARAGQLTKLLTGEA